MTARIMLAAALAATLSAAACGDDPSRAGDDSPDAGVGFGACSDSNPAFVRAAMLAVLGRRPRGQAEVQVYADLMAAVRALPAADDGPPLDPRAVVARALFDQDGFVNRWTRHFLDGMHVGDYGSLCYHLAADPHARGIDDGGFARYLRDHPASEPGAGFEAFAMPDVLRSALHLDDLSVAYRANLFAMLETPIEVPNAPSTAARELTRREVVGGVFDTVYLNRNLTCLGCHNSEASVTDHPDPALDRHFPVGGFLERAIYGDSTGIDPARAHAVFRMFGFISGEGRVSSAWGMNPRCGKMYPDDVPEDPAGVDGKFGAITGKRVTALDLEASLRRGVDALADHGLEVAADGEIGDPDQAFAYLVAMSVVESVWREVMGTPLTIANHFPRNQAASDLLAHLTDGFVASHFSLRELLVDIVTTEYFNRLPPEAGCGTDGPYELPNVFDPWVTSDADPARRLNGVADGIVPVSPPTLVGAAVEALEWPRPIDWDFVNDLEILKTSTYQRGLTGFLWKLAPGTRDLDFQGRLAWEGLFGRCESGEGEDYVDGLVARAQASDTATLGDVAATLEDRLTGDVSVLDDVPAAAGDAAAIEAMLGAPLETPAREVPDLEGAARRLCGALLSSPQFLMSGMSPAEPSAIPRLTAPADGYDAVCAEVAAASPATGLAVRCDDGGLTVEATP